MAPQLKSVVRELGGEAALGRRVRTEADVRDSIREGFPHAALQEVMRTSGLGLRDLAAVLDLSLRSLQRRRSGRLARNESDRLYRLARILALAHEFLGDRERSLQWLKRPNAALGGALPIEWLDTEVGARQIENVLGRVAYGGVS